MSSNFLLDNLAAILIGTAVILMLSAAQIRSSQAGVEQVASHASKAKMLSFGEWIEDDITSLGANIRNNTGRFLEPTVDEHGNTEAFTFFSDNPTGGGDTMRVMTRYRLVPTRTVTIDDSTHQLYEVRREFSEVEVENGEAAIPEYGSTAWISDGRSVATLSFFEIDLLDRQGLTATVGTADFIQIRFAMVPEIWLERGYIRELFWNTTLKIRPFWEPLTDEEEAT
jgi:hypothetical protein